MGTATGTAKGGHFTARLRLHLHGLEAGRLEARLDAGHGRLQLRAELRGMQLVRLQLVRLQLRLPWGGEGAIGRRRWGFGGLGARELGARAWG